MKSLLREGREWDVAPAPDGALVQEIQAALGCARPFAQVLARRGGRTWSRLIDPGVDRFHSPFLLAGMEAAVARLLQAVERGERLFVHGDFDVDGLSGAAVLYLGLAPLLPKETIKVEVGDRARGHGLSREFVARVIEERFPLVVTADCGVSNLDEVAALRAAGIDTIITDHHVPPPGSARSPRRDRSSLCRSELPEHLPGRSGGRLQARVRPVRAACAPSPARPP